MFDQKTLSILIPIYYHKKDAVSINFIVVLMQDIHKHYILWKADRVSPMSRSWLKVKGKNSGYRGNGRGDIDMRKWRPGDRDKPPGICWI